MSASRLDVPIDQLSKACNPDDLDFETAEEIEALERNDEGHPGQASSHDHRA